jgi:hypothetical protein
MIRSTVGLNLSAKLMNTSFNLLKNEGSHRISILQLSGMF